MSLGWVLSDNFRVGQLSASQLNEVETSIKKPTSLVLCDYLKMLSVSRKSLSVTKEGRLVRIRPNISIHPATLVIKAHFLITQNDD